MKLPGETNQKSMIFLRRNVSNTTVTSTSESIDFKARYLEKDTNNNFTVNSDGTVTCNKDMYILVKIQLYLNSVTAGNKELHIYKNGADSNVGYSRTYISSTYQTITFSSAVKVVAGDVISIQYAGATGDVINGPGVANHFILIEL